jgi:hypothetical protein
MPSVTDVQQQQQQPSNNSGKSTPPPPTTTTDSANTDPLSQAVLLLDKKQRNLGKRKEKLESYREEAKKGKELNKDQKEALEKYSDVLGQIECLKELNEQFKKLQTDSTKVQKSLSKQLAKEKREAVVQSVRQYAQVRYLLEHRPTVQSDQSVLLDQLSSVVIPSDNSPDSISRSVDTVLSIYQPGQSSTLKTLTGKNPQEVREILEDLTKNSEVQPEPPRSPTPPPPPQIISLPIEPEQQPTEVFEQTNEIPLPTRIVNDYPLQFDTRDQQIPLEQIMQDNTFFPIDLSAQIPEDNRDQTPDPNQFLTTMTVVNSNQASSAVENQPPQQQQLPDGLKQYNRGSGNRGGNRNYNRRGSNNYYPQYREGPRGGDGYYDNSYGRGRRPYSDHNRGRGGFRGNRGGNFRTHNYNGNGYQNAAQYQNVHSAPPSQQQ